MKPITFENLNPKAPLFEELKSGKYAWWEKVKNDPRLYIEIRKDNQINVYYEGGSVIRLHYCTRHKKVQAFTHVKYLYGKGDGYEECADKLDELLDTIITNIPKLYSQKNGTEKEKWSEKYIQGQYILKNRLQYIDSEFAYKEDPFDIRVDLVECIDGEIRFVELKRLDDGRMLKKTDESPEVVEQVKSYRKFILKHEKSIVDYYKKLWQIKNELGLPNTSEPQMIAKEPLLLIFNRWQKETKRREEHTRRMEKILRRENINYIIQVRNMKRTFYYSERNKQTKLYSKSFFGNARNGGHCTILDEKGNKKGEATDLAYILIPEDSKNNMFASIQQDALDYFQRYDISWWRQEEDGYFPTGHLVSSQIHCLNHLFALRKDKEAVKSIIENATGLQFDEVLPSLIDNEPESYISFEFAFHNEEWLQEDDEGSRRGTMCTSIDVMIFARRGKERWLIPIEWKYTETYNNTDKTNDTRMKRYAHLIEYSSQLKMPDEGIAHSVYFMEPSYELMRQTLLCEQIIAHGYADHFFHINIIPNMHYELRNAVKSMFIPMLNDKSKFCILDPQELLNPIVNNTEYADLIQYLQTRYWEK